MLIILPLLALICSPSLTLIFGKTKRLPTNNSPSHSRPETISIIIPARDEAQNLRTLLPSLTSQNPHQLIVANDNSTDETAAIASSLGAEVIHCPPPPHGWLGKTWACQTGANHATGTHLLFLDADTVLTANALTHLKTCLPLPSTAISICPYHTVIRPYEQLSAIPNLAMAAGINAFALLKGPEALFGQCLLISTENYKKVGGHKTVRTNLLENVALAGHLRKIHVKSKSFLGKGIIQMRMFPAGLQQLSNGWRKGIVAGASNSHPRALILISIWITGAITATISAFLTLTPATTPPFTIAAALAYITYAIQLSHSLKKIGSYHPLTGILFPIPLLYYQTLFLTSIIDQKLGRKIKWKGRHVD